MLALLARLTQSKGQMSKRSFRGLKPAESLHRPDWILLLHRTATLKLAIASFLLFWGGDARAKQTMIKSDVD